MLFKILISGPLLQIPNLRQTLEAYVECQQANLVGIVTDECEIYSVLDAQIGSLTYRLMAHTMLGFIRPPTFLSVAGKKILRDDIWGSLRLVFHADYHYYKRHRLYDFPQRSFKVRVINVT